MLRSPDGTFAASDPVQRFLRNVMVTAEGCWLWTASRDKDGYGKFSVGSPPHRWNGRAHRWSYERWVAPIPVGLQVDHLCRTRSCVNPTHLEAVDTLTNLMRGDTHAARNAAKTHCSHGHPYDDENTRRTSKGRTCRTCAREWMRAAAKVRRAA